MRNKIFDLIYEKALNDKNVILMIGDLGYGCIERFVQNIPGQIINAGISEQNMAGVAAGLAAKGKEVYVYSIGNFSSLRCIEQIRNDCAYHKLNVTFISNGAGFEYGALGMSHHATEDMAMMRCLPGVSVFSPADRNEVAEVFGGMQKVQGVKYLRVNKAKADLPKKPLSKFCLGSPNVYYSGRQILICAVGTIIFEAISAREKLAKTGYDIGIASFPCIKPVDIEKVTELLTRYTHIITVEEHNVIGGLGSLISEIICDRHIDASLVKMGLQDQYASKVGDYHYLRSIYGLDDEAIIQKIQDFNK